MKKMKAKPRILLLLVLGVVATLAGAGLFKLLSKP